jgi:hypothetical protein
MNVGPEVTQLVLHGTFITEASLSALRNCPNLVYIGLQSGS